MKEKIIALLPIIILGFIVLSGCIGESEENLSIKVENNSSLSDRLEFYVDGETVGAITVPAGDEEWLMTDIPVGEHFIKFIGQTYQISGETITGNVCFTINADGTISYYEF